MTDPARKLATYADLEALPEGVRAELIDGALVTQPAPLPEHARASSALARRIGGPFDDDDGRGGPGGWWILPDIDVQLSAHKVVRPDLAGWRRERLPSPWGVRPITVAPDWVCEILSPSNVSYDRVTKRELYARAGVPFFWLVDPAERVLEALTLRDGFWLLTGAYDDTALVRIAPFEAVELEVGRLFPPRSPGPRPNSEQ
ncbi:MAG: hypothetical protein RL701_7530 [Pseudomonadota bacterium]|jgi:Uma2 family endonuclease